MYLADDPNDSIFNHLNNFVKNCKKNDMSQSPIPMPIEECVVLKANKNAYQAKYIAAPFFSTVFAAAKASRRKA